jgi:hypothetical protein
MFLMRVCSIAFALTFSCVHAQLAAEGVPSSIGVRQGALVRMVDPAYINMQSYQKAVAYDVLVATALKGCGPIKWAAYMESLPRLPIIVPDDGPVEMFVLPPLVRYLYQFGDCLTETQKSSILGALVSGGKRQRLTGHGTINHAIMRAASWYLLAQYFPSAKWIDWDGKNYTSRELMRVLKSLLIRRGRHFFNNGQAELLSPTYALVNFFPLLNLIDFSADPELRRLADSEAVLELAALRAHSFYGVIVPPLTRKNYDQVNASDPGRNYIPSVTQQMLWYYYGEPRGLQEHDFRGGEPFYASMLALSNWRPPPVIAGITPGTGYRIRYNTPRFGIWDADTPVEIYGDSLIQKDFAIGTGNLLFQPAGYSGHIQTFSILLKSDKPYNQIECYHPFWRSNLGEDAWATDRSSPFQQMYRYDDSSVVMLFDIPDKDPWPQSMGNRFWKDRDKQADDLLKVVVCRVSRSFDEVVFDRNWVFVRQGDVFAAMASLHGEYVVDEASPDLLKNFYSIKVREPKTALFFRVDRGGEGLDFRGFQARMKSSALPAYNVAAGEVLLHEKSGDETEVKSRIQKLPGEGGWWSALPRVLRNGGEIMLDDYFVIDSPVLSVRDGVLRAESDKGVFELKN